MSVCDYREPEQTGPESLDLPEGVPPLRSFYLYLSSGCNLACRHCWITPIFVNGKPEPGDVIDPGELRKAVREAIPMGLKNVKLTGGEPLLHPGFREICDLISAEDLYLAMETNGTLISAELAHYLKNETVMDSVSVSIDSADPARHDAFRGVNGAFAAALRGLDYLVASGYDDVQVIMSVHRGNLDEIEEVALLAAEHGATSLKLNPVSSCGRGADMVRRGETLDFAERLALDRHVFQELGSSIVAGTTTIELILHTPPALMPLSEIIRRSGRTGDCGILGVLGFLGSGEIAMCGIGRNIPELVYGRLGRDSVREIWLQNPTILKLRRVLADVNSYPEICRECSMARQCRTGCVAQNFVNGRQLIWPDSLCAQAHRQGLFPRTRQKLANSADSAYTIL